MLFHANCSDQYCGYIMTNDTPPATLITRSPVNTEDTSTALMSTQHTKYCDDIVSATAAFVM